jgi:hypothetical protein
LEIYMLTRKCGFRIVKNNKLKEDSTEVNIQ